MRKILESSEARLFLGALAAYVFVVAALSNYWFIGDEGFYAISINDAISNGLKPYITYYGTPVFWKPFLMIDIYAALSYPLTLVLPYAMATRMVSALFSAFNVVLVYLLAREFMDEKKSFAAAIVFALNPAILIFGTKIFMEAIALTFILLSMLAAAAISKSAQIRQDMIALLAAAIILASLSKSATIGLMCLGLAGLYTFIMGRKQLPSIIAAGIIGAVAVLVFPLLTEFPEAYYMLYEEDFFSRRIGGDGFWVQNAASIGTLIMPLIPIYLFGAGKFSLKDKKQLFLALWIIPLLVIAFKTPYVWYAVYFVAPLTLLALSLIALDKLDLVVVSALVVIGVALFLFQNAGHAKSEGLPLVDFAEGNVEKSKCTLFAGTVIPTIHAYLDINGYAHESVASKKIQYVDGQLVLDANLTQEQLDALVYDYDNAAYPSKLSEFEYLFMRWDSAEETWFRTANGCSSFDYVMVTDHYDKHTLGPEYELIFDDDQFRVWKRRGE